MNDICILLEQRGLSNEEAKLFYSLLEKVTPTKEDEKTNDENWEHEFPFEGGMGFLEALTELRWTITF